MPLPFLLIVPVVTTIGTAVTATVATLVAKDKYAAYSEEKKVAIQFEISLAFAKVGFAVAKSDGEMSKEELDKVYETLACLDFSLKESQKKEIVDLLDNPPSIIEAFKDAKEINKKYEIPFEDFEKMIDEIIEADGEIKSREIEIKNNWNELKKNL